MSGVDAYRGINFQGAVALQVGIELLEDPGRGNALRIEGLEDIADIETLDGVGAVLRTIQVKSRAEPNTWGRADIIAILGRWNGTGVAFEFVTDGMLGPSGIIVRQALSDLKEPASSEVADRLVRDLARAQHEDEETTRERLSRCEVSSLTGKTEDLLLRCEYRLLLMLQRQQPGLQSGDSASRVNRLWRELTLAASRPGPGDRILTREQLAGLCGLDLELLDQTERWTPETAAAFLRAAAQGPAALVGVRMRPFSSMPPALSRGGQDPRTTESVGLTELPGSGDMLIVGATGSGKSVACQELARSRAAAGVFAVMLDDRSYVPGQLLASTADVIAAACRTRPLESQVSELLRDRSATLIIDGASELDAGSRRQLSDEIRDARRAGLRCQLIAAGRDISALRGLTDPGAPAFWPDSWTRGDQVQYAEAEGADTPTAIAYVTKADQILGSASGSPLLTVMALNVLAGGRQPRTRAELYSAFLDGLAARAGSEDTDVLFGWLGAAFARLIEQGLRQAGQLAWSRAMSDTLPVLAENGIDPGVTPGDALEEAIRIGLLVKPLPFASFGALHDSFGDYLAAAATRNRLAAEPSMTLPSQEEQVVFLCEMDGVTSERAAHAAEFAPLTAIKISRLDLRGTTESDEHEVGRLLRLLADGTVIAGTVSGLVRIHRQGTYVRAEWPAAEGIGRTVLVRSQYGPLNTAVSIWGALIRGALRTAAPAEHLPRVRTAAEGAKRLVAHQRAVQRELARLVEDLVPPSARPAVLAALPPPGMNAVVYEDSSPLDRDDLLHIAYTRTADDISAVPGSPPEPGLTGHGRSLLSSVLNRDPAMAAADALAAALARETEGKWPQ